MVRCPSLRAWAQLPGFAARTRPKCQPAHLLRQPFSTTIRRRQDETTTSSSRPDSSTSKLKSPENNNDGSPDSIDNSRAPAGATSSNSSEIMARLAKETKGISSVSFENPWSQPKDNVNYSSESFLSDSTSASTSHSPSMMAFLDAGMKGKIPSLASQVYPHKLSVYATKHNCHMTLTTPPKLQKNGTFQTKVLISVSCGNIGFRKAARGSYDAAYQLAAFVLQRIKDRGWLPQIKKLDVMFRGFGPGREAVSQALLGLEGRNLKGVVNSVMDGTRLKFGGTRSPAPRRLG